MKKEVTQIAIELTIHIIYAIRALENNLTWVIISSAVTVIAFVFFLMVITHYTCCRRRFTSNENTFNDTYVQYSDIVIDNDNLPKTRMSQYSMDTEHEFSYFDSIGENNRPAAEVATMKLLQTS